MWGTEMTFRWSTDSSFQASRTITSLGDTVLAMRIPNVTLTMDHFVDTPQKQKNKPKSSSTLPVKILRIYFQADDTTNPVNFDFDPDYQSIEAEAAAAAAAASSSSSSSSPASPHTIPLVFPICNTFNSEECILKLKLVSKVLP